MGVNETVTEKVISALTQMYQDEPTFNADKVAIIVNRVVNEVRARRRYNHAGYTEEQIALEMSNYFSQIYDLAEYDFAHLGAPHEQSHVENSINRTWVTRDKLFRGVIPLAKCGR